MAQVDGDAELVCRKRGHHLIRQDHGRKEHCAIRHVRAEPKERRGIISAADGFADGMGGQRLKQCHLLEVEQGQLHAAVHRQPCP